MSVADKSVITPERSAQAPGTAGRAALTEQILEGPELPLLLRLAAPNAVAFLVQASVSMAELGFVAQLGTVPLAALALVFPGLMLMQMLANGAVGGAVASAVARALGAGDQNRADALVWHALVIAVLAGLAFALAYFLAGPALLGVMGASPAVQAAAGDYAAVVFGAAVLIWITALASALLRGTGDMRFPASLMVLGAAIQVPLAGTFILGWFGMPALGLHGAAAAVVAVAAVNGALLLIRLTNGRARVALRVRHCRLQAATFADIFRVGLPATLSPLVTVATVMAVNALVAGFGAAALAGYGIAARLEFLLVPLAFGLGTAMTSMVGINAGAGQLDRAERIGWLGGFTAAGLTGTIGLALALAPGLWLDLFTDHPPSWAAGALYLQLVGPAFAFQGLGLALYFASQGAGTVAWPVLATLLRFVVGVGGAAAGVVLFQADLVWVYGCLAVGMILFGVVTAEAIRRGAWRHSGTW